MTIVEQKNCGFQWGEPWRGEDFKVVNLGSELRVTATAPRFTDEDSPCDLIRQYEKAPKQTPIGKQKTGLLSPEVTFANADTDEKLIAFVRRFGPVVANHFEHGLLVTKNHRAPGYLVAHQDLKELRNEHSIYRAALTLVAQLGQENFDKAVALEQMEIIASRIKKWPQQWKREKQLRKAEPPWRLTPESLRRIELLSLTLPNSFPPTGDQGAANIVLSELLNAFRSRVFPNQAEMHVSLWYGIRPLLYSLLRRQMFFPRDFAFCRNTRCKNFFHMERAGLEFCSPECSLQQRQRDYWQRSGKEVRKMRLESLKSKPISGGAAEACTVVR